MRIYFYHPIEFNFHSGITLGVIRDYTSLAKNNHEIYLYGTYSDDNGFAEIVDFIGDAPVRLMVRRGSLKQWRSLLKLFFLWKVLTDRQPGKVFVTRHLNKACDLLWLRPFLGRNCITVYEAHEDAFPHMTSDKPITIINRIKNKTEKVFKVLDGIILNNKSQDVALKNEFTSYPNTIIIPSGVEIERFARAISIPYHTDGPFIITYTGQFTAWKNVEMLFAAVGQLDQRYRLRIAGGKSGLSGYTETLEYLKRMEDMYGLQGRIDFRGFVQPTRLVDEVLHGSSVLAIPLGDNLRSRYLTSPLKLFEAMATSIPVVAVDFPSINLITGRNTVFLCQPNAEDFARAIQEAVHTPDRLERCRRMNEIVLQYSHIARAEHYHRWLTKTLNKQE
ncbi:MAG: glycosyltransferase family 4 protein [Magnetococcales bacterium]|nr:glycosyltransferase family 4 protein [Magnetococcales bacterium]